MVIIERSSSDELRNRWYSKDERATFAIQLKRDVRAALRKLDATPMDSFREQDFYDCVGIELFLSREILKSTPQRRYNHVLSILRAQSRQGLSHACNDEELSLISKQSSEWISTRCQNFAAMYWVTIKP
eukprot:CAMPEP_0181135986 /NCGR_PEP_ID=MMETSP1071-20121207/32946_1 /TAXON_ID=35127 /ORGANISM="Thalassiosira sp., Strain NH16" /LENGTH=128 /DNA_ID=CAMNT_0023222673 /DNA_START=87 /DNA_END=473 /DNA_ORIENTATION=+